jgi:uridine kinase
MTDIKPYIIITSGATGSGKSTIWQLIQKKYNLNANINSVLIDDLIESNKN